MTLIFLEFRSRAAKEERVLAALRRRANAMIRRGHAAAVVVCQRVDVPACVLWIQHHVGAVVPAVDGDEALPSAESGLVDSGGEPVRLELIDSIYNYPLPPCGLWAVETRNKDTGRALLGISQGAPSDPDIAGISIYRTSEHPCRTIAFLALAAGVAPDKYLESAKGRSKPDLTFYPLRVSWTIGRLTVGADSSRVRYPRTAFWARLGPVSPSETGDGRVGATHGDWREPEEFEMSAVGVIYVVTCGHCGQTWQVTSAVDGQTVECLFCGQRGRLSLGALPDTVPGGPPRVEARLS